MKYYRVKIGYGKDDFISVDETELERAIFAQGSGKVGVFKEGTVGGNHIMAIIPDYQRLMGWGRDYQLTGEDYDYVGKKERREHENFLIETKHKIEQIDGLTETRKLHE